MTRHCVLMNLGKDFWEEDSPSYKEWCDAYLEDHQVHFLKWVKTWTSRKDRSPESSRNLPGLSLQNGRCLLPMTLEVIKGKNHLQE